MKTKSPLVFSTLSFAFIILLVWFIGIGKPGTEWSENIELLNQSWNDFNSFSTIWRLEALVVCGIAWASFNLSSLSKWWNLVAVGHILMLTEYIFMLGGYKHVTSEEMFQVLNEMANWAFIASNLIWVVGMLGVFWQESKFVKIVGVVLSALATLLIGTVYFGLSEQTQLLSIAMPVILLLYAFNCYYGILIFKRLKGQQLTTE
ncbi:hypothetical protein [[Muricauda] lutisoli]|uniref:Uncharacterized protein n=1 Tax=[Muricauda] lutisoli TaxID=2816035 RepID=A0ABS3EWG3_9FLAO|nr:hypothetical protein [[Muricauda] lutisoli]MBO0330505.1 hypothetical protein [[Muricauda] lutisoli]